MCLTWLRSSIGKKALMAVSGLILVGFVIGHLLGNLLIYLGPDAINGYAQKLADMGLLLWAVRIFLGASVLAHIWASVQVTIENRRARPQPYRVQRTVETTMSAKTMMLSGLLLLAFIVYHLLHFTFRVTHPELSHATDALGRHDVYAMMVWSFLDPYITSVYIIGMFALCLHLSHGIGSTCQSLGLNNERTIPVVAQVGRFLAAALFIGYVSIPLAVLFGAIPIPGSRP